MYDIQAAPNEYTNLANRHDYTALKNSLAAHLPKNSAGPAPGSKARLVELKDDSFVYWLNERNEKDAKIPQYE